jgi:hypothetical protein
MEVLRHYCLRLYFTSAKFIKLFATAAAIKQCLSVTSEAWFVHLSETLAPTHSSGLSVCHRFC